MTKEELAKIPFKTGGHLAIDREGHKIVGIQDSTCIGFWELRCEKVE